MERLRFQGVGNIIRFNWHFYVLSLFFAGALLFSGGLFWGGRYWVYALLFSLLIVTVMGTSLLVSFYIYDLSGLYRLDWLEEEGEGMGRLAMGSDEERDRLAMGSDERGGRLTAGSGESGDRLATGLGEGGTGLSEGETGSGERAAGLMVNIHAGFDETSELLSRKFPTYALRVFDFYDRAKHTELSIARARRSYPPFPGTVPVTTAVLPLETGSVDRVFLIFAAHEIRAAEERARFFTELHRVLKPTGHIIVTEHLRDLPNFLAYTIGCFHFLPAAAWRATFREGGFTVCDKKKITPFITTYKLSKDGSTS